MSANIGYQLRALGRAQPPAAIELAQRAYRRVRVFKHDFFAATALYRRVDLTEHGVAGANDTIGAMRPKTDDLESQYPELAVVKFGRRQDFFGLPLEWLGAALVERECAVLERLRGVERIPRVLARFGRCGFAYGFIPGTPLDEKPAVGDRFFDELEGMISQVHARGVAYCDMNKRGNILLGEDGRPWLIDFQIAMGFDTSVPLLGWFARRALAVLQREDQYHLLKHKRRFRPDLMTKAELADSRRVSRAVAWHRKLTQPLTRLRRGFLGWLYERGWLRPADEGELSPETDPRRWARR